ncbi:MAG: helix-turn-helix transcriptional regulator [Candidatus Omnitrophica bacterium]|nr:helix-turn-helix transcriptional regulator [Candidatus Omnitrophota bacterium]
MDINLLELSPVYPKKPKTLGERIRRARMDKNMLIRELAEIIGVTEDSVINWEKRDMRPSGRSLERVKGFLES